MFPAKRSNSMAKSQKKLDGNGEENQLIRGGNGVRNIKADQVATQF